MIFSLKVPDSKCKVFHKSENSKKCLLFSPFKDSQMDVIGWTLKLTNSKVKLTMDFRNGSMKNFPKTDTMIRNSNSVT